jgi:hypothetical protein
VIAADLTEPIIGALATILVAVVGGLVTLWAPDFKRRHDQRREAEELVARYRRSLLTAAYDLQSRLYNIAEQHFLERMIKWGEEEDRFYAETSTLWLIGQYLGWVEIFRREAGLVISVVQRGDQLLALLERVGFTFALDTPEYGYMRVFRSHQSAIAEVMISEEARGTHRVKCLGYATFVKRLDEQDFARWFSRVRDDLDALAGTDGLTGATRVAALQNDLVELIEFLDQGTVAGQLERATVPGSVAAPPT